MEVENDVFFSKLVIGVAGQKFGHTHQIFFNTGESQIMTLSAVLRCRSF